MAPTVSGLFIYPVKSCGGISVSEASIEERGFRHDRRWMVTDDQGRFLTQREHPRLALARTAITDGVLEIHAKGMPTVGMPVEPSDGEEMAVEVWGQFVRALRGPGPVDAWFEQLLGVPCRIVHMPERSERVMKPKDAPEGRRIAFPDAFPFLLLSEASLEDLNGRTDQTYPMNRFRPNIVVAGCGPFAEDRWKEITIGGVPFDVVRPCERCATITVDQATGIRSTEPLRTLAAYRSEGARVFFGQNILHRAQGVLRVGQEVVIQSSRRVP